MINLKEQNNNDPLNLRGGGNDPLNLRGGGNDPLNLLGGGNDPLNLRGGGNDPLNLIPTPTPTPTPPPPNGNGFTDTTLTGDDLKAGKVVKYGMKGDIVGKIQELLIAKGYKNISRSGNVDKIFGNRTKQMVIDFQRANGLNDDGSVGKDTWPKLNDPNAVGASSSSPSSSAIQATSSSKPDEVAGSDAIIIQEERKKIFRKYLSQYK